APQGSGRRRRDHSRAREPVIRRVDRLARPPARRARVVESTPPRTSRRFCAVPCNACRVARTEPATPTRTPSCADRPRVWPLIQECVRPRLQHPRPELGGVITTARPGAATTREHCLRPSIPPRKLEDLTRALAHCSYAYMTLSASDRVRKRWRVMRRASGKT